MLKHCLLVSVVTIPGACAQAQRIAVTNCPAHFEGRFKGEHESAGPYELRSAHCINANGIDSLTSPSMAPDGSSIAWLNRDEVAVADVSSGQTRTFTTPLSNSSFRSSIKASLGVYGVMLAGWASNSKYPFYSAIRAAAQMVSYEVSEENRQLDGRATASRSGLPSRRWSTPRIFRFQV